jgi:glyoxylase-like metal-dependent hydrolase (beta-lactamase superfamily II)
LFPNAEFYASAEEIEYFKKHKAKALLHPLLSLKFNIKLKPLHDMNGLKVIPTPGHTQGSISLLYEKESILFSGDTLFENGIGRYDLPNSAPGKMQESLDKLKKIKYKILCPGHDY